MKRFLTDMNPTVRGFLIIGLVALTVVVLNLYTALASLAALARIAFFLAIAFFFYLIWRERREEIASWPGRARFALYGGVVVIVGTIGSFILVGASGPAAAAGLAAIILAAFAMFRAWRDQHTYGYGRPRREAARRPAGRAQRGSPWPRRRRSACRARYSSTPRCP